MVDGIAERNQYRTFGVPNLILVATDIADDIGYLLPHAMKAASVPIVTVSNCR
jgi:ribosomal protein L7Ae-like RNA K-turn-binding protein